MVASADPSALGVTDTRRPAAGCRDQAQTTLCQLHGRGWNLLDATMAKVGQGSGKWGPVSRFRLWGRIRSQGSTRGRANHLPTERLHEQPHKNQANPPCKPHAAVPPNPARVPLYVFPEGSGPRVAQVLGSLSPFWRQVEGGCTLSRPRSAPLPTSRREPRSHFKMEQVVGLPRPEPRMAIRTRMKLPGRRSILLDRGRPLSTLGQVDRWPPRRYCGSPFQFPAAMGLLAQHHGWRMPSDRFVL
jgi:hypothetical protein